MAVGIADASGDRVVIACNIIAPTFSAAAAKCLSARWAWPAVVLRRRCNGSVVRRTLGPLDALTVEDARVAARALLADVAARTVRCWLRRTCKSDSTVSRPRTPTRRAGHWRRCRRPGHGRRPSRPAGAAVGRPRGTGERQGASVAGRTLNGTDSGRARCSGPQKFVECVGDDALAPLAAAGDFAYVDPDESAAHGHIVSMRADEPGSATLVRRIAVESGRSVLRTANPGRPDLEVIRADETVIRAVVVFVGRAVRGATPRHYRFGGRKRPKAPSAACRPVGGIR